jgi:hypothetical protein
MRRGYFTCLAMNAVRYHRQPKSPISASSSNQIRHLTNMEMITRPTCKKKIASSAFQDIISVVIHFSKALANGLVVCGRSLCREIVSALSPAILGKLVRAKNAMQDCYTAVHLGYHHFPVCLNGVKDGELVRCAGEMRYDPSCFKRTASHRS